MKRLVIVLMLVSAFALQGCKKDAPTSSSNGDGTAVKPANNDGTVPIPLELPTPMFAGTPENLTGIENLEPDSKKPRPDFYAPVGVKNVALNKSLIQSWKK